MDGKGTFEWPDGKKYIGKKIYKIKVIIRKIRKLDTVNFSGVMEKFIKEIGKMVSNMDRVRWLMHQVIELSLNGWMEKEYEILVKFYISIN